MTTQTEPGIRRPKGPETLIVSYRCLDTTGHKVYYKLEWVAGEWRVLEAWSEVGCG